MKKILSGMLVLVMVLGLFTGMSIPAQAAGTGSINNALYGTYANGKLTAKWSAVKDATGYEVYVRDCDTIKFKAKPTKTVKGTSVSIKKLDGKAMNKKKVYKLCVRAYKEVRGEKEYIETSKTLHVAGKENGKYTNAKSVTISKKSATLEVGKSITVSGKIKKVSSGKKILGTDHTKAIRFYSTDTSVAKVNSSGKITAKGDGTCMVYAMAANGKKAGIKITVEGMYTITFKWEQMEYMETLSDEKYEEESENAGEISENFKLTGEYSGTFGDPITSLKVKKGQKVKFAAMYKTHKFDVISATLAGTEKKAEQRYRTSVDGDEYDFIVFEFDPITKDETCVMTYDWGVW